MHVVIEALGIDRPGGGRSATLNLLNGLFEADRETQYSVFLSRPEPSLAGRSNVRSIIAGDLSAIVARMWAQIVIPVFAKRRNVDLIHHVKNLTVAAPPCPTVVTIYDLTILRHPQVYPAVDRWYWRHVQPRALRAASRIIAISQETANDITRYYSVPAEKISVIYPSWSPRFAARPAGQPDTVLDRYGIRGDYLLHVGSISLKKNLSTLLRAYSNVRRRGFAHQLVLVGRVYQKGVDRSLAAMLADAALAGQVVLTGPVPDEDLPRLYRGAAALVFPSLHEGFGIVPLEAMASGTPVIASTGGALAEVVRDGGILVHDPLDDSAFSDAIEHVLRDPVFRASLVDRGRERARTFTTEAMARQTLDVYRRVTAAHRPALQP